MSTMFRYIIAGCFFLGGVMLLCALITYKPTNPSIVYDVASVTENDNANPLDAIAAHVAACGFFMYGYSVWALPVLLFTIALSMISTMSHSFFFSSGIRCIGSALLSVVSASLEYLFYQGDVPGSLPGGYLGRAGGLYVQQWFGAYGVFFLCIAALVLLLAVDQFTISYPVFSGASILFSRVYYGMRTGVIFFCVGGHVRVQASLNGLVRLCMTCADLLRALKCLAPLSESPVYQIFSDPFWQDIGQCSPMTLQHGIETTDELMTLSHTEEGMYSPYTAHEDSDFTDEIIAPYKTPAELFAGNVSIKSDDAVSDSVAHDGEDVERKAKKIVEKLNHFGIEGSIVSVTSGPVVTLFQYKPAATTKISALVARQADVALALGGLPVRIIAPMPGKPVVGFEVARRKRTIVPLHSLLVADEFTDASGTLPVVLGNSVAGDVVIANLAKMPHLLMAGSTGSGKSVGLNCLIMSLLWRQTPNRLKLVLIDPKRLEFGPYADIPHLLFPIITDVERIIPALQALVSEMERRYACLAKYGVRDIHQFHAQALPDEASAMPWIVVVIDELADVMMTAGKQTEQLIARLAQMARAAGIHLIVATQRPSVDVITGLIKVNFPTRMSFSLTTRGDSRTVLGRQGAEALLGKGDALYLDGKGVLTRVHCAYITHTEIKEVLTLIKKQQQPVYVDLETVTVSDNTDFDPLFDKIKAFVLSKDHVSISLLQREFTIGYNRSARIVEQLEKAGYLGPPLKSKHRSVIKAPSCHIGHERAVEK